MTDAPFQRLHCPICQTAYENTSYRCCPRDGSPLRTPEGNDVGWIGTTVQERYRVLRVLGRGGMSQVYVAQHLATGRNVALKILERRLNTDPVALDRFRREAQLLSRIAHPNVVAVEDFGTLPDGSLFMVMELVDGCTLQQLLEKRELRPREALEVTEQVCEAVEAAHTSGVVHRDIKPGNVFVETPRSDGKLRIKVLDFGISKLVDDKGPSGVTRAGAVFGTPEYMSPQQARGQPVDARADVYAMGVLLYRLLLGTVPFRGDSPLETLVKHMTEPVPWPVEQAARRKLPASARQVVMKALEKGLEQRYPSAQAFGDAVRSLRTRGSTGYSMVGGGTESVLPPPPKQGFTPPSMRTTTLARSSGSDHEVITLAPDVYWVGRRVGGALECNTYLRVYRKDEQRVCVLIDPGAPRDLRVIAAKIASVIGSVAKLDMAFINHQDPDVSANTAALQQINPRLHVVCSQDTWRLVLPTGLDARRFSAVEHFRDGVMRVSTGHEVVFVPTPYCHFRGAVMYYDRSSRVLFTGDLFGGLTDARHLLASGRQWSGIDTFHQIYMPTNRAVRAAIGRIRALDPPPRWLAPQHGAVIGEDEIADLMSHLEALPMGLDMDVTQSDTVQYRDALNELIPRLLDMIGLAPVRDRLKRFAGDGTFPDLITFDDDLRVQEIKLDPQPVADAVVRELSVAVPIDKMEAWLTQIHAAQNRHGIRFLGVPAP
ncbi:MAG: protein kinase domain-containing protein [Myxococcota bacterium]